MHVSVIREAGYDIALEGIKLSYHWSGRPAQGDEHYAYLASRLALKDNGSNKFLESIAVWLDVTAPRYFWAQMDTYRSGISKQSESTMHTITKAPLSQNNFEEPIPEEWLAQLNHLIDRQDLEAVKNLLPEGFLQRRIICTNYKTLRHIVRQRLNHRLPQWQFFVSALKEQLEHPEFIQA